MASTKKNLNATQSDLQIVQNYISRGELKDALIALDELSKRYPKDANLFFLVELAMAALATVSKLFYVSRKQ